MTEYRIVATLDTEHIRDGKRYHYDTAVCWWGGTTHRLQTYDKDKAEAFLKQAKEECPKFDALTQARTGRNDIRYWHTNIRIQTREVTEWK